MDVVQPTFPPPQESTDIFSLSDQVLSDRLQFIEEIGFGNWGSVWLCRPKTNSDSAMKLQDKIAVKLVHRSKTPTTAARVKSLWNEMKIVRTFKSDPHPSIIPFHSFIITPSYALITMSYCPTLVPVEVEESKAREWFRFLLSGVEFLHKRGVVHNDIKPANILLSHKNIPVLVDFGFAEKYDLISGKAFHSNLSYGTPEYLSPERARGMPHDTRKSDVWSLGITFFEILIGRTPFENSDGEQFSTKADLERYWSRTLRGKWVGSWKMSKGMEKLLRRMLAPNADLRCTALEAMADAYWNLPKEAEMAHRRSSSYNSSIQFEKELAKIMNMSPNWSCIANDPETPPGLADSSPAKMGSPNARRTLVKAKSQPKVNSSKARVQSKKRVPVPPIIDLSPIKGSPPTSPLSSAIGKENASVQNTSTMRKPFSPVSILNNSQTKANGENLPPAPKEKRSSRVLADLTGLSRNMDNPRRAKDKGRVKEKDRVKERVREWERERERLREMERLEELEKEREEELDRQQELVTKLQTQTRRAVSEKECDKENEREVKANRVTTGEPPTPVSTPEIHVIANNSPPRAADESGLGSIKHSLKISIDKTLRLYKSSTLGQGTGRTTPALSIDADDAVSRRSHSERESWEDDALVREAKSSLPVVRHAVRNERLAADSQVDRLTIWMRNVEKVVEDARQTFASSPKNVAPLPPLPLAPVSRRSSRLPRRVPASQIFTEEKSAASYDQSFTSARPSSSHASSTPVKDANFRRSKPEGQDPSMSVPQLQTPSRQRRATVSTRSPEPASSDVIESGSSSPSKRKEKSKSHNNLFQLGHISPVATLELELQKQSLPAPSPRLSAVVDRSLFIAKPGPQSTIEEDDTDLPQITISPTPDKSFDELQSSPLHVDPYPSRKLSDLENSVPDPLTQRRIEGVYDRFLMATSGVKRLGRGYQSDNAGPIANNPTLSLSNKHRAFYSARKPMPPPVSSADQRQTVSVDELGLMQMTYAPGSGSPILRDQSNTTVAFVRRAIKSIVPSKTASRRLSRVA